MKFTEILKKESAGWKKSEIIILSVLLIAIIIHAIIRNDSKIALISAICGILYTVIAGKGKSSCYIFGLCSSGCYSYLSFINALYGNLILNICYYIPAQILGFFSWNKNFKKNSRDIIKTKLNIKDRIIITITGITGSIISIFILKYLNDSNALIDGITTFLSILGMYLTVKRCIEQWIIWMIVNGLSVIMWTNIVLNGTKAYSTVCMWGVYFVLAMYFYINWKKEVK